MDIEQDLRFTSDEMLHALERLRELEVEKRSVQPGSARFRKLARDIEQLAATIFAKTVEQDQLGHAAVGAAEQLDAVLPPIEDIPPTRDLQVILSEWRDAERRLSAAQHGSPEHLEAQAAVHRLRSEYRDAYEAVSDEEARSAQ
jgi:hypothetical protein